MRIATKYPRIAERHFEGTGRQTEVIDVKGSVELAPLVGLADGIVDLVATGRTLEENGLEVLEEIIDSTRAPGREPGLAQAEGGGGRRHRRAPAPEGMKDAKATRVEWDGDDAVAMAAELRAQQPPLAEVSEEVAAIIAEVERDGDAALLRLEKKLGGVEPASIRVGASELAAARADTDPALLEVLGAAAENIEAVAALDPGPVRGSTTSGVDHHRRGPARLGGGLRARRPRLLPFHGSDVRRPGPGSGVGRIAFASPAGPDGRVNPLVLVAAELIGADEVYAIGGAQAIAALAIGTESVAGVDVIAGPGNRYVQEAKRQLTARRHRRHHGAERADGDRRRRRRDPPAGPGPVRPGRAWRGRAAGGLRARGGAAGRARAADR